MFYSDGSPTEYTANSEAIVEEEVAEKTADINE